MPSEAKWEYAAREGRNYWYAGGNQFEVIAWYQRNSRHDGILQASLRRRIKPNGYRLQDMSGNVWEMVEDCWDKMFYHQRAQGANGQPHLGGDCSLRVIRDKTWQYSWDLAVINRAGRRQSFHANDHGFRLPLRP